MDTSYLSVEKATRREVSLSEGLITIRDIVDKLIVIQDEDDIGSRTITEVEA